MQETLKSGVVLCELVNSFPIFAKSGDLQRFFFFINMKGLCDMGPIAGKSGISKVCEKDQFLRDAFRTAREHPVLLRCGKSLFCWWSSVDHGVMLLS